MALYEVIGQSNPTYLLADPTGAQKYAIPCEPGNGIVKRGTIMYRKSSGMYAPAESAQVSDSYYLCILDETVDTDANPAVAEDAGAYRAGRFVDGRVFLKDGETKATAAHKLVLRKQGILFDVMDDAEEFVNGKTLITYKANNGASPAEADYLDTCDEGASYTILGNDTTGFTAPSTKSFSKWNTKDDGTGTDYSAAASYTADEPLTLYAVWA